MKEIYICDFKIGEDVQDFFMLKSSSIRTGINKKQYMDMVLGDSTGEIGAKKWDINEAEIASLEELADGDIIKIRGSISEWNGIKQLKVVKVRKVSDADDVDVKDFVKAAPEDGENMLAYIKGAVVTMNDEELKSLCMKLLEDNEEKLLYYPAAAKNHHAEMAGLLYHIKRMLQVAEMICDVYKILNRDLVKTGVIIHDMEKLVEIESNEYGVASGYSFEGNLLGHLVQGVKLMDRTCEELGIGKEKAIMLQHMMISHHYEADYGSPKKPLFPEAEILHYLDMIDAKMYDIEAALKGVTPGEFSEKVWSMDNRRFYKSTFEENKDS